MEEKTKKPNITKKTEKARASSTKVENSKNADEGNRLIVAVRIAGEVEIKKEIVETLYRLRLRKKYACTIINPNNKGLMGMLDKVKHYVAYGIIDEKTLAKLLEVRGKSIHGNNKKIKINPGEAAKELMNGKTLEELGLKGFFRMHPPRGGIKSKQIYPKGVLGNHKNDINKLIERML